MEPKAKAESAPAVPAKKVPTIQQLISGEQMKKQFELALPKICSAEKFVRVVLTQFNKTPRLLACTKDSLLACLMACAELGIEPDGRRAHLIPYGDKCTVVIDYKGKIELAMRSGTVTNIHADKICENDVFEYNKGEIKNHIIDFRKPRGNAYAFYCIVRMKDGGEKCEVMTISEIHAIRDRSQGWKAFKSGKTHSNPWESDEDEMSKKTVFHRVAKWITLSPELRRSEEVDADESGLSVPVVTLDPNLKVEADKAGTGIEGMAAAVEGGN